MNDDVLGARVILNKIVFITIDCVIFYSELFLPLIFKLKNEYFNPIQDGGIIVPFTTFSSQLFNKNSFHLEILGHYPKSYARKYQKNLLIFTFLVRDIGKTTHG